MSKKPSAAPSDAALDAMIKVRIAEANEQRDKEERRNAWKRTPILAAIVAVAVFLGGRLGIDNASNTPHTANLIHYVLGTELAIEHNLKLKDSRLIEKIDAAVVEKLIAEPNTLATVVASVFRDYPFMAFHGSHVFGPVAAEPEVIDEDACSTSDLDQFVYRDESFPGCKVVRVKEYSNHFDMPIYAQPQDSITIILALDNKKIDFRTFEVRAEKVSAFLEKNLIVSIDGERVPLTKKNGKLTIPTYLSPEDNDYVLYLGEVNPKSRQEREADSILGVAPNLRIVEVMTTDNYPKDIITGAVVMTMINPNAEPVVPQVAR